MNSLKSSSEYDSAKLPANLIAKSDLYDDSEGSVDPIYQAKSRILNQAIQEIGMGKYQVSVTMMMRVDDVHSSFCHRSKWGLFAVAGFGWFSYVSSLFVCPCGSPDEAGRTAYAHTVIVSGR